MSFACGKSGFATEAQKQGKIQIEFLCFSVSVAIFLFPKGIKKLCLSESL
jgi:hypothetical protein